MRTADILGVKFHNITLQQAVDKTLHEIKAGQRGYIVTPNSEIAYQAKGDSVFLDLLNKATLVLPDGIGVIYAAKILKQKLSGRVAGIDFANALLYQMSKEKMSLFLLGAKPGVAEQAASELLKKYPGLRITGTKDGYFQNDEDAVQAIRDAGGADVLFVCLGAPRQEQFMSNYLQELPITIGCGLGGSLDVFAGNVKRAPDIFIKFGLEWLYRLLKEPSRIGRMMRLPLFMLVVLKEKMFGKPIGDQKK